MSDKYVLPQAAAPAGGPDSATFAGSVLVSVKEACARWQAAFNRGDAQACAELYESGAVLHAHPYGAFHGISQIRQFWQDLIDRGYDSLEILGKSVHVLADDNALQTAEWKTANSCGSFFRRLWIVAADGTAKLREDGFTEKCR